MASYYNIGNAPLGNSYTPGGNTPFDARRYVKTFNDLLDLNSFAKRVYEGMLVDVVEELCVYKLISLDDSKNGSKIGLQFDTKNLDNNKKLWKRLTIETINANNDNDEAGALTRAKNNLVNGALIYIANDIKSGEELVQKSGLYFCQNVDGEGRLTMAGGGVTTEEFNELNNKVDVDKVSTAIEAAIAALVDGAPEDLNTLKELSAALKDNPSVIEALNSAIGEKANQSEVEEALGKRYTKDEVDEEITKAISDLTKNMVVGEGEDPTIANAINYAIHNVLATPL